MEPLEANRFFDRLGGRTHDARMPEGFTLELTYGCNLRCVHCFNPTHRALPQELSTAELLDLLGQAADMGTLRVSFTGGEALTRPDVFDLFHEARRLGLVPSLLTNATRITATLAAALGEVGFETVYVSLYGATTGTYERVTGQPDSHGAFLAGLAHLAAAGVHTVVRMPVLIDNAHELAAARSLVEGYGFKFQYFTDIMPTSDGDPGPLRHRLSPTEKVAVNEAMVGYALPPAEEPSCGGDRPFMACACGHNRFAVTPYGEMNLCVAFPIPKYDLRRGTLREGWEVLKRTVDEARPNDRYECPTCEVRRYCRQSPADAWLETKDMSRCLPHFKELACLEKVACEYLDPRRPR